MEHQSGAEEMGLTRDQRRSLLDLIDPGDGRIKSGVILTYSAEAAPLVAILSTLAGHLLTNEEAVDQALSDGFRVMRDIEALSERVRILLNVGGLRTPGGTGDRMAALLDMVVREVVPMKNDAPDPGCSFHPKLLIFEYESARQVENSEPSEIRLFVCTRNVTTDDSMDTIASLRLVERKSFTENGERINGFLREAFSATKEKKIPKRIEGLIERIKKMDIEPLHNVSSRIEDIEFFGQIPEQISLSSQMAISNSEVRDRIIISPFIDETTLNAFSLDNAKLCTLLSERRDYTKICSLQDGVKLLSTNFSCFEINRDADQSFHSLHAKIILDKLDDSTSVIVGSANATKRAWNGANWEAVIRFRASPLYFDQAFKDLFVDNETENKAALCVPYTPIAEDKVEETVEDICKNTIIRGNLTYSINPVSDDTISIEVNFKANELVTSDQQRKVASISFRVLGESESHTATFANGAWMACWNVRIASFSSILVIDASFFEGNGFVSIRINRCLIVESDLLLQRNQCLRAELIQTQGIHEILQAILEGVGFGFATDFGEGGGSWSSGDAGGLPVANLEALIFLCLKDDPESLAKRAMIADIMNAKFSELPSGACPIRAERHRKLFTSVKKIWMQLESEYPMEFSEPWDA